MVKTMSSVNHALVRWSRLINQTWVSVFLGIKNTEVRAYRTDPVQVRSCLLSWSATLYTKLGLYFIPMWDDSMALFQLLTLENFINL
ncbi:hypothetical protein Hanom_Chr08g00749271 [Helianthus anomalus]